MADIFGSDKTRVNYNTPKNKNQWMQDWLAGVPTEQGVRQTSIGPTPVADPNARMLNPRERMLNTRDSSQFMRSQQRASELKSNPLVKGMGNIGENFIQAPAGLANVIMDALQGDSKIPEGIRTLVELAFENGDLLINPMKAAGKGMWLAGVKAGDNLLINPRAAKALVAKIDALEKLAVPNPTNMLQQMNVISDASKYGSPVLKVFDPKDIPDKYAKIHPNTFTSATSSHRGALGATVSNIQRMRGQPVDPLMYNTYDLAAGSSEFGRGFKTTPDGNRVRREYLEGGFVDPKTGLFRRSPASTNEEAMLISTQYPNSKSWYATQGLVDQSTLTPYEVDDIHKNYKKTLQDITLQDILAGVEHTPRFKGDPRLMVDREGALLNFEVQPQGYMPFNVREVLGSDTYRPAVFSNSMTIGDNTPLKEKWGDRIIRATGREPAAYSEVDLNDYPAVMRDIAKLAESPDPNMRWIAQQVADGKLNAMDGQKVNPLFLEQLDDLLYREQDLIQERMGAIRTNDPRSGSMLGGHKYTDGYRDWDAYNTERGMSDNVLGFGNAEYRVNELNDFLAGKIPMPIWVKLLLER